MYPVILTVLILVATRVETVPIKETIRTPEHLEILKAVMVIPEGLVVIVVRKETVALPIKEVRHHAAVHHLEDRQAVHLSKDQHRAGVAAAIQVEAAVPGAAVAVHQDHEALLVEAVAINSPGTM